MVARPYLPSRERRPMTVSSLARLLTLVLACGLGAACSSPAPENEPRDSDRDEDEDPASSGDDASVPVADGGPGDDAGVDAGPVTPPPDPFDVVSGGAAVDIFVDADDDPAVLRAVGDLQADVERVSGVVPVVTNDLASLSPRAILVGTLGKSPAIDALVAAGKLDVSKVQGRWESFAVQAVDAPVSGVERALVIAGSDRRGTIYGIYDISEELGVSPWYWWADVTPIVKDVVRVNAAPRQEGEPSIRYRGIFINDEENMAAWSSSLDPGKKMGPETYKKVFELLLRLKANLLWPAIHKVSDPFTMHAENSSNADAYGIIVSRSFSNTEEWHEWAGSHQVNGVTPTYDYSVYPEVVRGFWDSIVARTAEYENMYPSFGMRGLNDTAMLAVNAPTKEEKVALLDVILRDQEDMVAMRTPSGRPAPINTFMPYKEALDLYNAGVDVPDDITLLWPEDNHGYVRQIPTDAERARTGGNGTYYHISYWGPPNQSYLWLNSTPPALMREELRKAYDTGAKEVLVLNVGDIKPHEIGTEFAMRFAYRADEYGEGNVRDFLVDLAARDFSREHAEEIAEIVTRYFQIAIARRPEFMKKGVYSSVSYGDEGRRVLNELTSLMKRAEGISAQLPAERVDAFYEMVLFPLRATKLTVQKYVGADLTDMDAAQGRRKGTTLHRDKVHETHASILRELDYYNTKLASGKWNKIMNPFNTQQPTIEGVPALAETPPAASGSALGVVVEGQTREGPATLRFSAYTEDVRFVDIFTKSDAGFEWTAAVTQPWVVLSKASGTIVDETRVQVSIDWARVPSGASSATLTIAAGASSKSVALQVSKPTYPSKSELEGYVEANGYVAIEAEHFTGKTERGGSEWRVLSDLGRSGDSVKVFPDLAASVDSDIAERAASLEYKIYFETTGTFPVTVYRLPTLSAGKCRLAIGLDDGAPQVLSGVSSVNQAGWRTTLLEQIEKLAGSIVVSTPGYHTLRLYQVDPSIVVDRIVVDTGGLLPSYLGPPESYRN
jgi:hypothetical protein